MNRRDFVAGLAAVGGVILLPRHGLAQVQYFDARPSAPALQRSLSPPAGMPPDAVRALPPERRPAAGIMVNFEFNSAQLTPDARDTLDVLGGVVDKLREYRFRIEGHTDAVGSDEYNLGLSQRRATSVVNYLIIRHRIDPGQLEAVGYGKRRLRDPANPASGVNRRVEISNLGGWVRPPGPMPTPRSAAPPS